MIDKNAVEKEVICTECLHNDVCVYKEMLLTAKNAIENLRVGISCEEEKKGYLKDLDFLCVKLDCKHYSPKGVYNIRG